MTPSAPVHDSMIQYKTAKIHHEGVFWGPSEVKCGLHHPINPSSSLSSVPQPKFLLFNSCLWQCLCAYIAPGRNIQPGEVEFDLTFTVSCEPYKGYLRDGTWVNAGLRKRLFSLTRTYQYHS